MRHYRIAVAVLCLVGLGCRQKRSRPSCAKVYSDTLTALMQKSDLDAGIRDECKTIVAEQSVRTELLDRDAIARDAKLMKDWEYRILSGSVEKLAPLESCYRSINLIQASAGVHITVYMNPKRDVVLVTSSVVFF